MCAHAYGGLAIAMASVGVGVGFIGVRRVVGYRMDEPDASVLVTQHKALGVSAVERGWAIWQLVIVHQVEDVGCAGVQRCEGLGG